MEQGAGTSADFGTTTGTAATMGQSASVARGTETTPTSIPVKQGTGPAMVCSCLARGSTPAVCAVSIWQQS